jgi:hypothetical protein
MNARDALRELTEVMQKVSSAHLTIADLLDRQEALLEVPYYNFAINDLYFLFMLHSCQPFILSSTIVEQGYNN